MDQETLKSRSRCVQSLPYKTFVVYGLEGEKREVIHTPPAGFQGSPNMSAKEQ
jgi:hypothetical protein